MSTKTSILRIDPAPGPPETPHLNTSLLLLSSLMFPLKLSSSKMNSSKQAGVDPPDGSIRRMQSSSLSSSHGSGAMTGTLG